MKWSFKKITGHAPRLMTVAVIVAAFALGLFVRGCRPGRHMPADGPGDAQQESAAQFWTCSMHPQIQQPGPGQCPLCGMDLVPVVTAGAGDDVGPRQLRLSQTAVKLAEIQVAPVERKFVEAEVRMVGKIDYDETRLGYITAWVAGRIDRMYVDYTGVPVKQGEHMMSVYSPDLIVAQRELIEEINAAKETGMKERVDLVREKLLLWGLTQSQIDEIEQRGTPSDHVTIYSPMSGIVIHKNGFEGLYVNTGTRIYTIADLSRVWVRLDAYESDLAWIRYGQEVEFTTEAYPGDVFTGKIAFIDPVLNAKTRTVKVRVNVSNPDGKLKPEMFVRAVVRAKVASGGKVMDAVLAGKWVCPMHPDVVEGEPGFCSVCEMPLVRPESLGYVTVDPAGMSAPLVVPVSAPLITGRRAVVYVVVPGKESVYEGREVVLGPRAGDYYLVRDGLEEGEMVVVNGNFKIDSALQILAKPSMMSPEGGAPPPGHDHGAMPGMVGEEVTEQADVSSFTDIPDEFKKLLDPVVTAYFEVQQALSRDNLQAAQSGTKKIADALGAVDMGLLDGPAHMAWMRESDNLKKSVDVMAGADDIEQTRSGFLLLSESMAAVAKQFGTAGVRPVLRFHCPMAFNGRGADWLQNKPETENPYFGAAMFKCGQQTEVIVEGPSS